MAAAILDQMTRIEGTEYLFPAARDHVRGKETTTFNAWSKSKTEFDAKCDVTGWTLHDLRRVFATGLAELGVLPHIIERLLNHKLGSISNKTDSIVSAVAEIDNRATYMWEMREATDKWEAFLAGLLEAHRQTAVPLAA